MNEAEQRAFFKWEVIIGRCGNVGLLVAGVVIVSCSLCRLNINAIGAGKFAAAILSGVFFVICGIYLAAYRAKWGLQVIKEVRKPVANPNVNDLQQRINDLEAQRQETLKSLLDGLSTALVARPDHVMIPHVMTILGQQEDIVNGLRTILAELEKRRDEHSVQEGEKPGELQQ